MLVPTVAGQVNPALINEVSAQLKLIGIFGTEADYIDLDTAIKRRIIVIDMPGVLIEDTIDMTHGTAPIDPKTAGRKGENGSWQGLDWQDTNLHPWHPNLGQVDGYYSHGTKRSGCRALGLSAHDHNLRWVHEEIKADFEGISRLIARKRR